MKLKLFKYRPSQSTWARQRGYVGYIRNPQGKRAWLTTANGVKQEVERLNQQLLQGGNSLTALLHKKPALGSLLLNIDTLLDSMGLTFQHVYDEYTSRATALAFSNCLSGYRDYVKLRFENRKCSRRHMQNVEFWAAKAPAGLKSKSIPELERNFIIAEMTALRKNDGSKYASASLKAAQDVYCSALTIIGNVPKEKNPFVFDDFYYKPNRTYLPVEMVTAILDWFKTYEPGLLAYLLLRVFCGRRHHELIGRKEFDQSTNSLTTIYTVLNRDLNFRDSQTRSSVTKNGETQIAYWVPAMTEWMKFAKVGAPDASIIRLGPKSQRPLSETAVEWIMQQAWRDCFGRDKPYQKNWCRHTAVTYATAVWGPYLAASFIGVSTAVLKKHYDGVASRDEGIRFFNVFPKEYTGPTTDLYAWLNVRNNRLPTT